MGEKFQLFAVGATLYHWTPSESLDNPDSDSPMATPTTTTTYVVTAREGSCAEALQSVKVVVNPLPTVDAGEDKYLAVGRSVQLQATGTNINRVEWDADPALSCLICYDPIAAPKQTTTFHITAFTNKNCRAYDTVTVHVQCDGSQLFVPNTFTPNGDGLNDYFFPRGEGGIKIIKVFRVFDRWGEIVFEKKDMQVNAEFNGWDGTYHGRKLAPDVYVYVMQTDCDNGESLMWKGDVTLLK